MEEFFYVNQKIFFDPCGGADGTGKSASGKAEGIDPYVPQRAQARRAEREERDASEQKRHDGIERENAPADAKGKEKTAPESQKPEKPVEKRGEFPAAPDTHGAEQVVEQGERQPEQEGDEQDAELKQRSGGHISRRAARADRGGRRKFPRRRGRRCAPPRRVLRRLPEESRCVKTPLR